MLIPRFLPRLRSLRLRSGQAGQGSGQAAGLEADMVVLDQGYLTVPEDEIVEINPLLTIVGGQARRLQQVATSHRTAYGFWQRGSFNRKFALALRSLELFIRDL